VKSPPIESPIRRWREEAGLTQAQLAAATGISSTTLIWNELLLYPEPSSRIISVFQHGSRVRPYSPPVGPLGSYQNYVDEYNAAQRYHRKLSDWSNGLDLSQLNNRIWLKALSKREGVSERLRGRVLTISSEPVPNEEVRGITGGTKELREVEEKGISRPQTEYTTSTRQEYDASSHSIIVDRNDPSANISSPVILHPFEEWRLSLGYTERVGFCRAACVSPPQVLNYERARQRSMPKTVRAALNQVLPSNFLDRLEYYGALYYRYRNLGTDL
jgi:Helix-turn-helix